MTHLMTHLVTKTDRRHNNLPDDFADKLNKYFIDNKIKLRTHFCYLI